MANIQDGSLVTVFIGDKALAYSTSCSLSVSNELQDANWKGASASGKNPSKKDGIVTWSISADGLTEFDDNATYSNYISVLDATLAGTKVDVKFGVGTYVDELNPGLAAAATGDIYYSGSAYIDSTEGSFTANEDGTYSVSFTGSGALTKVVVSA